mgnify:CR=1 FL=1
MRDVTLWDEVKDTLHKKGTFLSGGQQQRLCIARALAFDPEVILLDEPTSALDPVATSKIEDLLVKLKENYSILMVTHNMSQAARISDYSMFMYLGELVEYGKTKDMFKTLDSKGLLPALVVTENIDSKALRAIRNLKNGKGMSVDGFSVYEAVKFENLIIEEKAIKKIKRYFKFFIKFEY